MAYSYFFRRFSPVILHIFDYQCILCNHGPQNLEVHHLDNNSKNDEPFNLIPVCKKCHVFLHSKFLLSEITYTRYQYKELQKLAVFRRSQF